MTSIQRVGKIRNLCVETPPSERRAGRPLRLSSERQRTPTDRKAERRLSTLKQQSVPTITERPNAASTKRERAKLPEMTLAPHRLHPTMEMLVHWANVSYIVTLVIVGFLTFVICHFCKQVTSATPVAHLGGGSRVGLEFLGARHTQRLPPAAASRRSRTGCSHRGPDLLPKHPGTGP